MEPLPRAAMATESARSESFGLSLETTPRGGRTLLVKKLLRDANTLQEPATQEPPTPRGKSVVVAHRVRAGQTIELLSTHERATLREEELMQRGTNPQSVVLTKGHQRLPRHDADGLVVTHSVLGDADEYEASVRARLVELEQLDAIEATRARVPFEPRPPEKKRIGIHVGPQAPPPLLSGVAPHEPAQPQPRQRARRISERFTGASRAANQQKNWEKCGRPAPCATDRLPPRSATPQPDARTSAPHLPQPPPPPPVAPPLP